MPISDINGHCSDICPLKGQSCGGRVLRCLRDNFDSLASKTCSEEVFYYMKVGTVDSIRRDSSVVCHHVL